MCRIREKNPVRNGSDRVGLGLRRSIVGERSALSHQFAVQVRMFLKGRPAVHPEQVVQYDHIADGQFQRERARAVFQRIHQVIEIFRLVHIFRIGKLVDKANARFVVVIEKYASLHFLRHVFARRRLEGRFDRPPSMRSRTISTSASSAMPFTTAFPFPTKPRCWICG